MAEYLILYSDTSPMYLQCSGMQSHSKKQKDTANKTEYFRQRNPGKKQLFNDNICLRNLNTKDGTK